MPESRPHLGKVISVHETSPLLIQRAMIVAVVSFFFFLAMLVVFYIRQQIGYFVLSSAFLVVYLFTMIGIWMQKRNTVHIHENGISYKKFVASWDQIVSVAADPESGIKISKTSGETVSLNRSISDIDAIVRTIESRIQK